MYSSYCKFEGAYQEMERCLNDVQDHVDESAEYPISDRECNCFRKMVKEMVWFLNDNFLLDDTGNLDEEELEMVIRAMQKGEEA